MSLEDTFNAGEQIQFERYTGKRSTYLNLCFT